MKDNIDAEKVYSQQLALYGEYKKTGFNLDMSRGRPSLAQLNLSNGFFDVLTSESNFIGSQDYRNYGIIDGIPEAKALFSEFCGVDKEEIMVLGNSSLNIMYDIFQRGMQFGVLGNPPLNEQGGIKWLCPVPGYDRHFAITELFGVKMINIPMRDDGPDMNIVENLVENDASIKGIWCVPKYSNPQGIVYSDEVVKRFAALRPKAPDFRIYWDNAYMAHHHGEDVPLLNLFREAKKCGNEDIVYMFGSTSKMTFAGGGVAFVVADRKNLCSFGKYMRMQTIGYDKLNQLAHVRFFKNADGIREHMKKHAELLRPKFRAVMDILNEGLRDIADWREPRGGYFLSIDLPEGTAKRTVFLAEQAGVKFTPAGSAFPYKKDPADSNIRIAPTYPPVDELRTAMKVFCCCARLAYYEKITGRL